MKPYMMQRQSYSHTNKKEDETLADHVQNANDLINTVEHYESGIFYDRHIVQYKADRDKEEGTQLISTKEYNEQVIDNNKAMSLLKNACHKRYGCSYSRSEISSLSK